MITPIRLCFQYSPCRQLLVEAPSQPRVPATCICVSCMAVPIITPPACPLLAGTLCLQVLLLHAGLVVACCSVGYARAAPQLCHSCKAVLCYTVLCHAAWKAQCTILAGLCHAMLADGGASPSSAVLLAGCSMPGPTIPHCAGFACTEAPPLHGCATLSCSMPCQSKLPRLSGAIYAALCYAVPCCASHAVPCYDVPCHVVTSCPMPCHAVPGHDVLYCPMPCLTVPSTPCCAMVSHAMLCHPHHAQVAQDIFPAVHNTSLAAQDMLPSGQTCPHQNTSCPQQHRTHPLQDRTHSLAQRKAQGQPQQGLTAAGNGKRRQ